MLRIVNLEEIQGMLATSSGLVDKLDNHDPHVVDDAKTWLVNLETALSNNHMPVAGSVAALRGMLVSAQLGVIPDGIVLSGQPVKRRVLAATVAFIMRESNRVVYDSVARERERVDEAERIMRQLVAIAHARGLIVVPPKGDQRHDALKALWSRVTAEPDLAAGAVSVEGLVGPLDALILLDRAIARDIA